MTRRNFLRLAGSSVIGTIIVGCGGGSGGGETTEINPGGFTASQNGSVLANTQAFFTVTTRYVESVGGLKVIGIARNGKVLFSGENLVFTINGQRFESSSATDTQVHQGDLIAWKSL